MGTGTDVEGGPTPATPGRTELAHATYRAFAAGEREVSERLFASDFIFHSPPDRKLSREGCFERCWPNSGNLRDFDFVRTIEAGDEVIVTYEATRTDGSRFRNTEGLAFAGARVGGVEGEFGW